MIFVHKTHTSYENYEIALFCCNQHEFFYAPNHCNHLRFVLFWWAHGIEQKKKCRNRTTFNCVAIFINILCFQSWIVFFLFVALIIRYFFVLFPILRATTHISKLHTHPVFFSILCFIYMCVYLFSNWFICLTSDSFEENKFRDFFHSLRLNLYVFKENELEYSWWNTFVLPPKVDGSTKQNGFGIYFIW